MPLGAMLASQYVPTDGVTGLSGSSTTVTTHASFCCPDVPPEGFRRLQPQHNPPLGPQHVVLLDDMSRIFQMVVFIVTSHFLLSFTPRGAIASSHTFRIGQKCPSGLIQSQTHINVRTSPGGCLALAGKPESAEVQMIDVSS